VDVIPVEIPLTEGQQITVQLFNFRKELMRTDIFKDQEGVWELTPEQSLELVPGIYYFNIHLETLDAEEETTKLKLTNTYEINVKGF